MKLVHFKLVLTQVLCFLFFSVLEELFLGIPWQVWKLAFIVLLISFFTVMYLVPRALKFIECSVLKIHKKR